MDHNHSQKKSELPKIDNEMAFVCNLNDGSD